MFAYQDPTGTDFLARQGALAAYRCKLHGQYAIAAGEPGTHFKTLEKFGQLKPGKLAETATITWEAFPIKQGGSPDNRIDRDRQELQEEYVEWSLAVARDGIQTLTFTTEFPDYFEALADVRFEALVAGLRQMMPEAQPKPEELLGVTTPPGALVADGVVGPKTWRVLSRVAGMKASAVDQSLVRLGDRGPAVEQLQERLKLLGLLNGIDGDFGPLTERAVKQAQQQYRGGGELFRQQLMANPWNDGTRGIYCMFQRFNRLSFLFKLVSQCAVPRAVNPRSVCERVSPHCVPERSSDPVVCTATQRLAQSDRFVTLKDPVKIRLLELKGRWRLNGQDLDINNPAKNQGLWQVSRGGQRGVLRLLPGLEVDSAAIRSGAQVARKLIVGVDVLVADASSFR